MAWALAQEQNMGNFDKHPMRDIFYIPPSQQAIHSRLDNWSRWVKPGKGSAVCPMFRLARSNSRQWHQPELRPTCDTKDAQHIERTIRKLPETHALIIRWWYVWQYPELKIRRQFGLTRESLLNSIIIARDMVNSLA